MHDQITSRKAVGISAHKQIGESGERVGVDFDRPWVLSIHGTYVRTSVRYIRVGPM